MKWLESSNSSALRESHKQIEGRIGSGVSSDIPKRNKRIELSENSRTILEKRYLRKDKNGKPVEDVEEMFSRISTAIAEPDRGFTDVNKTEVEFYNMLTTKKFFPNSPTFTGAGTPLGQLAACFVLPVEDDMGRHPDGIFSTLKNAALIQQTGGGNGFSFSRLRSKGSFVARSGGKATGPLGFLKVYDAAFGEIAQGGVRRGANMAVLRVDHPDIRDFIKCKSDEGEVSNFNISVAVTDTFMKAVADDTTYELIDPHTKEVKDTPRAKEIFEMIVKYAHRNGEPGVLFVDTANKQNPVPHLYSLEATNPCGEQWLGPYENCCLGSINLAEHLDGEGVLDWESLKETTKLSTRFLDNVVTANSYVPEVPQLKKAAMAARRIGLGFMGLADVMYSMGIRYGSDEGQEFSAQVTEFIRFYSMEASIELAKERGSFEAIEGSIYDPTDLKWEIPQPVKPYTKSYGRPEINWDEIEAGIKAHGIRNGTTMTVAPTGTISTVAGVEGYGCEPVFALAYYRNVYQAAMDEEGLTLTYTSPMFIEALDKAGIKGDERKQIIDEVIEKGSCQNVASLPEQLRNTFVVSADITAEEHVMMQASIQAFIDNSISKTCNFSEDATQEDVANVYQLGWALGCKGLTVYVTGSRDEVVLETKEVKESKEKLETDQLAVSRSRKRPDKFDGATYKMATPQGNAYVTINKDEKEMPIEIFMNVGKAGSDVAALSEALGRALSGWFHAAINPMETVKEVVSQFSGIGGSRSVGFGSNRVSSIPDAVAKVLSKEFNLLVKTNGSTHVEEDEHGQEQVGSGKGISVSVTDDVAKHVKNSIFASADMCPECGNHTFVKEEGCQKCYNCGHSVC